MEQETRISAIRNGNFVKTLRSAGKYSEEIYSLVEEDLAYGLTEEQIKVYLKRNYQLAQMQVFSQALRKGVDDKILARMAAADLNGHQMQVVLEFYEKGISIETVEDIMTQKHSPAVMRRMFQSVLDKSDTVKHSAEAAPDYMKQMVEQISEVVEKIHFQEKRYDELNQKLRVFESTKEDEKIRENLLKRLADAEADLSSRQEQLNQANVVIARLREQEEEWKKEKSRMQIRLETLEDTILNRIPAEQSEKTMGNGAESQGAIPVYYQIPVMDGHAKVLQHIPMEQSVKKNPHKGIAGLFARLGIKKKSYQNIVKLVAAGELVPAQLVQIKNAMERGLTEGQLVEMIQHNVSAEKMKEIIEIAVLENSME